jgi:hypothetical protein
LEPELNITPKKPLYQRVFKFLVWLSITLIIFIGIGISLVFIYEDDVKALAIKELNKHLKAEVRIDPKNIDLTFISSFPNCAIEFKKITAMEALQKKERDTLLYAESLSLHFNIKDLFSKKYIIKQISLKNAECFLKVDKNGKPNYIVWESELSEPANTASDSLKFNLDDILITNFSVSYKNKSKKIKTEFVVNTLAFKGNFTENKYELFSKGSVYINSITVDKTNYIKNKKLNLDIEFAVNNNNYEIKKSELLLNQMMFVVTGNLIYKDSLQNLQLDYKAKNLDIESVLSLLPDNYKSRINEYKSTGEFYALGNLNYTSSKPLAINSKFGLNNATIEYTPKSTKLTKVELTGELLLNKNQSFLNLSNINATLNGDNFSGKFLINDFNNPFIDISANGNFNLQNVYSFWPIDTLSKLEGAVKINTEVKGLLSDLKNETFSTKVKLDIEASITNLVAQFKGDENLFSIENCSVTAKDREVEVKELKLKRGASDIVLNGKLPGIFNYLANKTEPLIITGNLFSNYIKLEDFMIKYKSSEDKTAPLIPANIQFKLNAAILKFSYSKFEAQSVTGEIEIKNQKVIISDMKLNTMEGEAEIDVFADNAANKLDVVLQSKLKNINVAKMFYQLNNFGQTTIKENNLKGFATAAIDFSGSWNNALEPNLNSIASIADFTIERGELIDFKPLESLSRFVDLKELQRIKFSSLSSKLEIKNSTIYVPQTSIKNSALNIDFNGTHTFNNEIDYHIRLLISELLSKKRKQKDDEFGPVENDPDNKRSAFILMTGNLDNPTIKYDKKGLKQKIKEDLKQEKQTIKQLLKEEFGLFKKDSISKKTSNKSDQKFELEKPNNNPQKKPLEPKKKSDDDDDF